MSSLFLSRITPDSFDSPVANAGSAHNQALSTAEPVSQRNSLNQVTLCDVLVSMATPPILLAVIGGQLAVRSIAAAGQLSEDLLRGDRLPVLHFPQSPPESES